MRNLSFFNLTTELVSNLLLYFMLLTQIFKLLQLDLNALLSVVD